MNILIFSKDRALQLLSCIQSLMNNFKEINDADIHVLYKTTNSEFEEGYNLVKNKLKHVTNIKWNKEKSFYEQVKNIISNFQDELTMFLVDDIIFVNNFSLHDQQFGLVKNSNLLAISLRLHSGINHCYAINSKTTLPKFVKNCVWDWKTAEGDWNYPMSVDGNVYKTEFIKEIIGKINFNNPNIFEASLDSIKNYYNIPLYLCCYPEAPRLINIPANRVQNTFNNRNEQSFSVEELNKILLSGKQIDFMAYNGIKPNTVHVPTVYSFV